jgi:hypothetical protein
VLDLLARTAWSDNFVVDICNSRGDELHSGVLTCWWLGPQRGAAPPTATTIEPYKAEQTYLSLPGSPFFFLPDVSSYQAPGARLVSLCLGIFALTFYGLLWYCQMRVQPRPWAPFVWRYLRALSRLPLKVYRLWGHIPNCCRVFVVM